MVRLYVSTRRCVQAYVVARSSLMEQIWAYQFDHVGLRVIWDKGMRGEVKKALLDIDGVLTFKN